MPGSVVDVTGDLAGPVAAAADALGGVSGLVHAAGAVAVEPVGGFTADSWDRVVDVNLRAHALLVQELLPHLQRAENASVVGISSIEGLRANAFIPAYCASKAGMLGLTRSTAEIRLPWSSRSPVVIWTSPMCLRSRDTCGFACPRTRPHTSYPSSSRCSARYEPSCPVMPVMSARLDSGSSMG